MSAYDQALMFEDNAALTSTRVSTNVIPLGNISSGNAEINIGGSDLFLNGKVRTTFQSGGSSTLDITLNTDALDTFGSEAQIMAIPQIAKATLVAGYTFSRPLPPGAYEAYLRATLTVGTADFTAGKLDLWIGPQEGRFVAADAVQSNA